MFKPGVLEKAGELLQQLKFAGIRVDMDDNEATSPGFKFNECEMKGIPLRLEVGPREMPLAVQLFGSDPEMVSRMAARIEDCLLYTSRCV